MLCNKCYAFKASKEAVLFRDGAYWCEEHYDTAFLKEGRENRLTKEKLHKATRLLSKIANGTVTEEDKDLLMTYKESNSIFDLGFGLE